MCVMFHSHKCFLEAHWNFLALGAILMPEPLPGECFSGQELLSSRLLGIVDRYSAVKLACLLAFSVLYGQEEHETEPRK